MWLQDWTGKRVTSFGDRLWWTWQLDRQRYPGWKKLVRDLNADGIQVTTYINPGWVDPAPKAIPRSATSTTKPSRRATPSRPSRDSRCMMDQNGFDAGARDFTNPDAVDWYADVIAEDVLGPARWASWRTSGGASVRRLRSSSTGTRCWCTTSTRSCGLGGPGGLRPGRTAGLRMAFMRSAFLGRAGPDDVGRRPDGQLHADQDGMASGVYGMLSGGSVGLALWHSDIGGYEHQRGGQELRAATGTQPAVGADAGVRGRDAPHEGNRPAQNQQVYDTPDTRPRSREASQIYAALYPYQDGDRRGGGHWCPRLCARPGWSIPARTDADLSSSSASTC